MIFDEVMSGFRVSLGGAQEIYNIKPDLTALGKVIGGGLPVGAFGGKKEIMNYLAPEGPYIRLAPFWKPTSNGSWSNFTQSIDCSKSI